MLNQKTLLIFSPTIEDGGVEKNLFNISNFLSTKIGNIFLITANTNKKKNFNKKINIIAPNSYYWIHKSRLIKTLICLKLFILNSLNPSNSLP